MTNQDTNRKLIDAAKRLLTDGTSPSDITVRGIAAAAGVNPAMINYCFKSKDALLKSAVDEIISGEFSRYSRDTTPDSAPKEQLRELLLHICMAMIRYREIARVSIPYLMLNDEISLPLDLLPYIKRHFCGAKDETACRVIAFQLVYTMQLVYYRAEDFRRYCGVDVCDERQLEAFLDLQLELLLGDGR
jgi:AcrR family transcriptional regulator